MKISVLIPNFNNGPSASKCGTFNFLETCLRSLNDTIPDGDDVEIIICDDGSTDDSLEIIEGFMETDHHLDVDLIYGKENSGLCRSTNLMVAEAKGDILMRLDGDAAILTYGWPAKVRQFFFRAPKDVGIMGPVQLHPSGNVWAFGDFILHPSGYHHVGKGMHGSAFNNLFPARRDHTMGACYLFRREVFDELEGFDERIFRADCIDFSIRAMRAGYSIKVTPEFKFVHYHTLRKKRDCPMDDRQNIMADIRLLKQEHGFNWQNAHVDPGLKQVLNFYKTHDQGELLWNNSVWDRVT